MRPAPVPLTRLAALRLLVGGYAVMFLLVRSGSFWFAARLPARQFEPIGVLSGLRGPLPLGLATGLFLVTVGLGVAFVLGWRYRVAGPVFAVSFLAVASYRLSFGHVSHTEHLCALHLLVLSVAPAADTWSIDARRFARRVRVADAAERVRTSTEAVPRAGWATALMGLITVITYALAGLAKVRHGGMAWVTGDVLRNHVAYDNLRKELLGSPHSPVGAWLLQHRAVFPPLAVCTLVIEIGAVVVLIPWRFAVHVRAGWAAAAWSFHVGIVVVMAISFPYQLSFIAYASLLSPERLVERALAWGRATTLRRGWANPP